MKKAKYRGKEYDISTLRKMGVCSVSSECIRERVKLGWKIDQAVLAPHNTGNKSKISWSQGRHMRLLYSTGQYSLKDLAVIYDCSHTTVSTIVNDVV